MKGCLLKQIENQEKTARQFGFYWEHFSQLIEQIQSECLEIQDAWQKKDHRHLQEEIGDLMQAAASLAIFCEFDPHETLLMASEKFQKRYNKLVELAIQDGHVNLHDQSCEILLNYWKKAKEDCSD